MGINNPVPRDLGQEAKKAAKILTSFVKPNQIVNYQEVIPPHVLRNAKGLAILTVLKAGFLFSGRAGSGVIVARLPDGTWSPPSAIMTAGAGAGGMIGAELTDFIFVLNNNDGVKAFSSFGTLTLGGNISVAAGPLGRSGEAAGAAGTGAVAAIFSYAKTKGLYAGISLEGSAIVERKDANAKFYGRAVTAQAILSGRVKAPRACAPLFRILDSRAFRDDWDDEWATGDVYDDIPDEVESVYSTRTRSRNTSSGRSGRYGDEDDDYNDGYGSDNDYDRGDRRGGASSRSAYPPSGSGSGRRRGGSSRYDDDYSDEDDGYNSPRRSRSVRSSGRGYTDDYSARRSGTRDDDYDDYDRRDRDRDRDRDRFADRDRDRDRGSGYRSSRDRDYDDRDSRDSRDTRARDRSPPPKPKPAAAAGGMQAIALYSFGGEESGDLPFRKGDVIRITAKSDSTDDWWTGELNGRTGIFPANYVELA